MMYKIACLGKTFIAEDRFLEGSLVGQLPTGFGCNPVFARTNAGIQNCGLLGERQRLKVGIVVAVIVGVEYSMTCRYSH